jgi:hypothetical protein
MVNLSKRLRIDKLEESGRIEGYTVTQILRRSLMEATVHQKRARRVTMINCNGEATLLLTKHVHISLWEDKVD